MSLPIFKIPKDSSSISINGRFKIIFDYLRSLSGQDLAAGVSSIQEGDGINVDSSNPSSPIVSLIDTPVLSVSEGTGVTVNNADPQNPVISADFELDAASPQTVTKIWAGTQTQYNNLTPNSSTLYFIIS